MAKGRIKAGELKAHEKVLMLMLSGEPITKTEIMSKHNELFEYRMSHYIANNRTVFDAVVKVHKNGKKVIAYQLMNVDKVKQKMIQMGILKAPIQKIEDLGAEQIVKEQDTASV